MVDDDGVPLFQELIGANVGIVLTTVPAQHEVGTLRVHPARLIHLDEVGVVPWADTQAFTVEHVLQGFLESQGCIERDSSEHVRVLD